MLPASALYRQSPDVLRVAQIADYCNDKRIVIHPSAGTSILNHLEINFAWGHFHPEQRHKNICSLEPTLYCIRLVTIPDHTGQQLASMASPWCPALTVSPKAVFGSAIEFSHPDLWDNRITNPCQVQHLPVYCKSTLDPKSYGLCNLGSELRQLDGNKSLYCVPLVLIRILNLITAL